MFIYCVSISCACLGLFPQAAANPNVSFHFDWFSIAINYSRSVLLQIEFDLSCRIQYDKRAQRRRRSRINKRQSLHDCWLKAKKRRNLHDFNLIANAQNAISFLIFTKSQSSKSTLKAASWKMRAHELLSLLSAWESIKRQNYELKIESWTQHLQIKFTRKRLNSTRKFIFSVDCGNLYRNEI